MAKGSIRRLVDSDETGCIDAQEFAVLYDAIKRDLEEDLEKQAALEKEASSATRRFKMLLLFVAVLISFLAASVAANFAVLFTFVDSAITTATTGAGLLEVKGTDTIVRTAIATQDFPLLAAPALDLDTLAEVKSLKVVYSTISSQRVEAQLTVVGVRKHNATFVEFVTSVPGETVEALNGVASLVRYPTSANRLTHSVRHGICSANATCSAFRARGIDADAALEKARAALEEGGFADASRRLAKAVREGLCGPGIWTFATCGIFGGLPCPPGTVLDALAYYYSGYVPTPEDARHVVFMLHGWTGHAAQMWYFYCIFGTFVCPALEVDQFRHLVFTFPTSPIMGYYDQDGPMDWGLAWGPLIEVTPTMETGVALLSTFMCGTPLAWSIGYCVGSGWLSMFGIGPFSEAMIFGFSNGGAFGYFAHWAHGDVVSKSVAVDFYPHGDVYTWVPLYAAAGGGSNTHAKIYMNCASWTYGEDGLDMMAAIIGADPTAQVELGVPFGGFGLGYVEYDVYTWSNPYDGRYIQYAVHGLNPVSGLCDPAYQFMCPGCDGKFTHMQVPLYTDLVGDVLDWVGESFISAAGSTGSAYGWSKGYGGAGVYVYNPKSPPAPPPPPSPPGKPSPPPFPPWDSWLDDTDDDDYPCVGGDGGGSGSGGEVLPTPPPADACPCVSHSPYCNPATGWCYPSSTSPAVKAYNPFTANPNCYACDAHYPGYVPDEGGKPVCWKWWPFKEPVPAHTPWPFTTPLETEACKDPLPVCWHPMQPTYEGECWPPVVNPPCDSKLLGNIAEWADDEGRGLCRPQCTDEEMQRFADEFTMMGGVSPQSYGMQMDKLLMTCVPPICPDAKLPLLANKMGKEYYEELVKFNCAPPVCDDETLGSLQNIQEMNKIEQVYKQKGCKPRVCGMKETEEIIKSLAGTEGKRRRAEEEGGDAPRPIQIAHAALKDVKCLPPEGNPQESKRGRRLAFACPPSPPPSPPPPPAPSPPPPPPKFPKPWWKPYKPKPDEKGKFPCLKWKDGSDECDRKPPWVSDDAPPPPPRR